MARFIADEHGNVEDIDRDRPGASLSPAVAKPPRTPRSWVVYIQMFMVIILFLLVGVILLAIFQGRPPWQGGSYGDGLSPIQRQMKEEQDERIGHYLREEERRKLLDGDNARSRYEPGSRQDSQEEQEKHFLGLPPGMHPLSTPGPHSADPAHP